MCRYLRGFLFGISPSKSLPPPLCGVVAMDMSACATCSAPAQFLSSLTREPGSRVCHVIDRPGTRHCTSFSGHTTLHYKSPTQKQRGCKCSNRGEGCWQYFLRHAGQGCIAKSHSSLFH